jgi:ribA/ribD-fused uncharacterized protein
MIDSFDGEYRFLSNFWPATVVLDGLMYPTVEHAYQAAKTDVFACRLVIQAADTPGQAKRLGRRMPLRPDWERVKQDVMASLLRQKFAPGTGLADQLLATGYEGLIEGNSWHDNYWGVCYCPKCCNRGQNRLGKLLMNIRKELRDGQGD